VKVKKILFGKLKNSIQNFAWIGAVKKTEVASNP